MKMSGFLKKMMGILYGVEANTITYYLQKAFKDSEIEKNSVTRIFRVTASDGKSYSVKHYNLKAIIAAGIYIANIKRLLQSDASLPSPLSFKGYDSEDSVEHVVKFDL